jgi:hypothetical protein
VTAAPAVWSSARLIELDFSGIEAVLLGWFMRDPAYIRLAKLGMHAYVASHVLKRPADLRWADPELAAYFKAIKNADDVATQTAYNQSKRTVHGKGYGMTVYGLLRNNPALFPDLKAAQRIDDVYTAIAPALPAFHTAVRHTAHTQHYLGGSGVYTYDADKRWVQGHPYGYLLWFWSVVAYEKLTLTQKLWREKRKMPLIDIGGVPFGVTLGEDAKAVVAYYPQSTARGVLTEAALPLFDRDDPLADTYYIGDVYYGDTPLRAPIHDSLLLEVPTRKVDWVLERAGASMQRPVEALPCPIDWGQGTHLRIGVDAKVGLDWGHMEKVSLPSWAPGLEVSREVASDTPYTPDDADQEEDVLDLEVRIA